MSKPEDVNQEAWEKSEALLRLIQTDADGWTGWASTRTRATISRAIMSAEKRGEERERAACELIAQDWTGGAEYIAAAIRKRGA